MRRTRSHGRMRGSSTRSCWAARCRGRAPACASSPAGCARRVRCRSPRPSCVQVQILRCLRLLAEQAGCGRRAKYYGRPATRRAKSHLPQSCEQRSCVLSSCTSHVSGLRYPHAMHHFNAGGGLCAGTVPARDCTLWLQPRRAAGRLQLQPDSGTPAPQLLLRHSPQPVMLPRILCAYPAQCISSSSGSTDDTPFQCRRWDSR